MSYFQAVRIYAGLESLVFAALLVVGVLTGFAIPAAILHLPMWAVIAAVLLRRSRNAGDREVALR